MSKNFTSTLGQLVVFSLVTFLLTLLGLTTASGQCTPISTLSCEQVQVPLPYSLSFSSGVPGTLADKAGVGTGFTLADAYSGTRHSEDGSPSNAEVPGYEPSKLTLTGGRLQVVTNKGIAATTSNNQLNALGVKVDSRGSLTLEVTLVNPYYGTAYQQGGLWLGLNNKTYLKLIVVGNKVELRREVNDVSGTSDQRITASISGLNNQTVQLRLVVDPATSQAQGYYSTDGTTYLNVGASYATPSVSIASMGLSASTAYAGIFATHRNGTSPVTYTFDDFSVSGATESPAENNPPVVVTAPVNQAFTTGQTFSFSGGQYSDPDTGDELTYTAALAAGEALPGWLQFDATNVSFSGTAPSTATNLSVSVTATDKAGAAVNATFTIEVKSGSTTQCSPMSTLPCEQVQVPLPYSLSFSSGVAGTLADKAGVGTGFTLADAYTGTRLAEDGTPSNAEVPGYEPSKLTLTGGRLQVVTNKGIAAATNNNQLNALGVKVDSRSRLTMEVSLVNPYYGTAYQQAGLWLGLNDKTYVKLAVVGNKVELRREVNDVTGNEDQRITGSISGVNTATVRLRLVLDPATGMLEGFYSLNGSAYTGVGTALSAAGMGLTASTAYAGVFATHRNGTSPVTYTFDDFSISGGTSLTNNPPLVMTAPANQAFTTGQTFSFSGGKYSDPDTGDALTYTAALSTGAALPGWLQFDATNVSFSGTTPSTATSLSVRVTATDKAGASVNATFSLSVQSPSTSGNTYLVVENMDKFPAPDRLTFSLIQNPWRRQNEDGTYTPYNANHNKVRLKISNKGSGILRIDQLNLSNASAWKIATLNGLDYNSTTSLPLSLSTGASAEAVIEFIAKDQATRVKVLNDKLTIVSNDNIAPVKEIKLHGLWQRQGEGSYEPYAVQIMQAFGFLTRTGFNSNDGVIDGTAVVPNSDEIVSAFFVRADAAKPVYVIQMAAYHNCCASTERFQWYYKGSTTITTLFAHNTLDGQSLLPRKSGSATLLAEGTFNPTGAFGFKIANSYSDRTLNFDGKIGMRIWKAIDANGNIIPNAYIIGGDYLTSPYVNYDYQDNIYYVSNVRPEVGAAHYSVLEATPSAVNFGDVLAGGVKSLNVQLKNLGKTYADGSSDPSATIKSIQLAGPDAGEFTFTPPSTSTLSPQGTASISVGFRPGSKGLKNAALLINYSSADSQLRIPLYGVANDASTVISVAKRIKSAADASTTIGGNAWEADINYRKGSIKLDKQVVAGPIASTDDDVLYQTYLSASADLAETRYEIPISNGSYYVRMHFVENFFSAVGARVFNINMEDQLRLSGFDIYREVGYRAALVEDFDVNVTDGLLNIKFNPTVNRLAIAGVEVFKVTSSGNAVASASVTQSSMVEPTGLKLQVYPNPNTGEMLHVVLDGFGQQENVDVTLYDMAGRAVHSERIVVNEQGYSSSELAVGRSLNRGMYILKAKGISGEARIKLMLE